MRVEVRQGPNSEIFEACPIESAVSNNIESILSQIEFHKYQNIPASRQIREAFEGFFNKNGWILDFPLVPSLQTDLPKTNYYVDAVFDAVTYDCTHSHRFVLEFCFDNRQAVGTNLLKFELATRNFSMSSNRAVTTMSICADRNTLKNLGWDGSIASSEEYELALRSTYNQILTSKILLFVLRP